MKLSIIKYSLLGALVSFIAALITYAADMGLFPLIVFGLMFAFLIVAGLLAIDEIYKDHKPEVLSKEERAKVRKMFLVNILVLIIFEILLFVLDYKDFFEELGSTNYVLSKTIYVGLSIGCGISGALMTKSVVLEYCGSKRYAQLNWAVRLSYQLIWFCLLSNIHF